MSKTIRVRPRAGELAARLTGNLAADDGGVPANGSSHGSPRANSCATNLLRTSSREHPSRLHDKIGQLVVFMQFVSNPWNRTGCIAEPD